ncbi:MAG: hypothetical protein KBH23_04190 [Bacteroidaceae bacterium]|nr:hypothetical protein [Bacteroidaceae bacterium]
MKKLLSLFFLLCTLTLQGQNLEQAKKMLEGGDKTQAEKALKKLAAKRDVEANLLLGKLLLSEYRFEEAKQSLTNYQTLATKAKKTLETDTEKLLQQATRGSEMYLGIADIAFIDTFSVDKKSFLEAYKISEDMGSLFMHDSLGTGFENELGNKQIYSEKEQLYSRQKQLGEWSAPILLSSTINEKEGCNYPFLRSDGITFYFASKGHNSLGGYDIFVTRYDSDKGTFLQPNNLGMPFNSPSNDYMMVIDEVNNLGWFASDRNQPEGRVCIYVFIPQESQKVYDQENMEDAQLIRLARIATLKESWKGHEKEVLDAKLRLQKTLENRTQSKEPKKAVKDFELVINDQYTYTSLKDFHSTNAKQQATQWKEKQKQYKVLMQNLCQARTKYATASAVEKQNMKLSILDLEKRERSLCEEIAQLELSIRREELKSIK